MLNISLLLSKTRPYSKKIPLNSVWLFSTLQIAQCRSALVLVSPMQTPDSESVTEAIWQHRVTEEYLCADGSSHALVKSAFSICCFTRKAQNLFTPSSCPKN